MDDLIINEDERRSLIEWVQNTPVCSLKSIIMQQDGVVGNHYHKKKDEIFLLLTGFAESVRIGSKEYTNVTAPFKWVIPRDTYHAFDLRKGSILLSAATEPFDPEDDYV